MPPSAAAPSRAGARFRRASPSIAASAAPMSCSAPGVGQLPGGVLAERIARRRTSSTPIGSPAAQIASLSISSARASLSSPTRSTQDLAGVALDLRHRARRSCARPTPRASCGRPPTRGRRRPSDTPSRATSRASAPPRRGRARCPARARRGTPTTASVSAAFQPPLRRPPLVAAPVDLRDEHEALAQEERARVAGGDDVGPGRGVLARRHQPLDGARSKRARSRPRATSTFGRSFPTMRYAGFRSATPVSLLPVLLALIAPSGR